MSEIMYKRPIIRARQDPLPHTGKRDIKPGTLLYDIINASKVPHVTTKPWSQPIYMKDVYLNLLNKSHVAAGLDPVYPNIPDSTVTIKKFETPEIIQGDPNIIRVVPKYLKSGIVRIKLDTSLMETVQKLNSTQKPQPIKTWVQVCKNIGMSEKFISNMVTKHEKRIEHGKKVASKMEAIFEGLGAAKTKKKKEKKEKEKETKNEDDILMEETDNLEENLPKDDDVNEDEGMDMEVDEDDIDDTENQEEEYYSDGE